MAKQVTATALVEGPWALPDGWRWKRLGDVAELIRGVTYAKPQVRSEDDHSALALLRGNNIQSGSLHFEDLTYVDEACVKSHQLIQAEDIVLTMSSGSIALIGKSGWAARDLGRTTFGAFCGVIRSNGISSRLLYHFLQTDHYRRIIRDLAKGTNINNLKRDHLIEMAVPVPPTDTQVSIVTRIDELFAEIDDGEAALARARGDLATWRKALLKAAVTGELTADWRAANPPTETGADLLARMLAERRARSEAEPRNRSKRYVEPDGPQTASLPPIPTGWIWTNIAQIAIVDSGGTPLGIEAASAPKGEVPWFKVSSMSLPGNETELRVSPWWLSREQARKANLRIFPAGSLVFPKLGGALLTNKRRLLAMDGCLDLNNMAVSPMSGVGEYIAALFSVIDFADLSDGSVVPQLKRQAVDAIKIALPPAPELHEVVNRVRTAFDAGSELGIEASELKMVSATLRQSVLAAAFRGELA